MFWNTTYDDIVLYKSGVKNKKQFHKQYTAVDYSSSTNILILVYFVHPIIWTFSLYINSGCGKREEHNNIWSMVMQGQHPLLELPWGLLALCQRTLGSERHRYAIAWPDKLGTDPMVCGAGKNIWTPPRNSGRIPSTRFSVSIENEQADKRRYSQTCLAKPNSQARTGARKFSPVQLTINRIGNLTQLICTLLYVMTTHTCIRILYCRVYPQLPPVIGAPWGLKKNLNAFVAGTLRGYFLPVRYGSVGVQLTRLRALYQGTLTSGCVWKNLNTSYLYNAAILASFFFIRVFEGVLSSEFVD